MNSYASGPIVIQCATPHEFQALQGALENPTLERSGRRKFFRARAGSHEVIGLFGALGKVWAAASCEFSIQFFKPSAVIDFGAAGGLVSGLRVGDLIIASHVVEHDVCSISPVIRWDVACSFQFCKPPVSFPEFSQLSIDGQSSVRITGGILAAGDQDVHELEHRSRIAQAHDAIAVCWEASAIGRVCSFHDIPFASFRVITDVGQGEFYAEYKTGIREVLPSAAAVLVRNLKPSKSLF